MSLILGNTLRDKVSGFTGVATSKTDFMTGNVQYSLQPPIKDGGALPESVGFDAHQLETVVPNATVIPFIEAPADTGILLGEKVKDQVTGVEGIAVRRHTFLNGCIYYSIQDTKPNKDGTIIEHFLEWKRLQRTGAGVTAKINKAPPQKAARDTGGPNTRGTQARG